MRAVSTVQAREAESGSYHFAPDGEDRSPCGAVNAESPFAADAHRVLGAEVAERLGHEVCRRCESIADP
ncbi:hypothetical protein [Halorussus sp. AFM4]|uniref:hypothetical protein n=1 Tax=Halorussus sp. AFM4 TaxID=3421651 RepID=UPI003EBBA2D4